MQRDEHYPYIEEYADSVDNAIKNKTMTIGQDNIIIKGEANSQFIPFLINRKYKGVDLTSQTIRIHYVNSNNQGDYNEPINVEYDDSQIRFGWLVPASACLVQGDLKVAVEIIGKNSQEDEYVWKSYMYFMSVEKSLDTGEGIVDPGQEWYVAFTRQVEVLNKRIQEITNSDVNYGAEIRDARVDSTGEVHETMNERFEADLTKMYDKKNYELIEQNEGKIYTCWIGTSAKYEALTKEEKEKYVEYKITDEPENICGLKPDDVFKLDIDNNLTPVVKKASTLSIPDKTITAKNLTTGYLTIPYDHKCKSLLCLSGYVGNMSNSTFPTLTFNECIPLFELSSINNYSFVVLASDTIMYAISLQITFVSDGIMIRLNHKNNTNITDVVIEQFKVIDLE